MTKFASTRAGDDCHTNELTTSIWLLQYTMHRLNSPQGRPLFTAHRERGKCASQMNSSDSNRTSLHTSHVVGDVTGILREGSFRARIEREQSLALRYAHTFSVLSYDLATLEYDDARIQCFVEVLHTRLRSSDEIGWLDDGRIGVLLPLTSLTVARSLEVELRDELESIDVVHGEDSPEARIYYFPPYQNLCDESSWDSIPPGGCTDEFAKQDAVERACTLSAGGGNGHASVQTATPVRAVQLLPLEPFSLHASPRWKRTMDVVGAALGLLLLSPLLLLVALVVKCSSPGPIFFRQQRVGYLGRSFSIFKFRTMHTHVDTNSHQQYVAQLADGNAALTKLCNEQDFVFLGRLLRKTAIDELPQLINVLRGEMSLVGPRPDVVPLDEYPLWQRARFNVLPGLTGLWQVSGKNRTTFQEMIQLDIEYVQRLSVPFDLKILARTVPAILQQLGDQSA